MIQPHQSSGYYKRSQGYPFSCNDTCPLVPCMAGGLAESLRHFSGLAVGETAAILSEAKVECGGGSFPRC